MSSKKYAMNYRKLINTDKTENYYDTEIPFIHNS